jgi:hypothetical protein
VERVNTAFQTMGNALQEQLLKARVANKQQAQQANSQRRKKQKRGAVQQSLESSTEQVKQQQAEKLARDRELNRLKQAELKEKADLAQLRQLIQVNRLKRDDGEKPYNFIDEKRVRKIYVTETIFSQLGAGMASIVKLDERYEVVLMAIAEKIAEVDCHAVINRAPSTEKSAEEEEYAEYPIPDDLIW